MDALTTASVIVIGDEVLAGKVEESNGVYLSAQLRELGVALRDLHVIPDDASRIAETVADASRRFDLVFTTGGMGPTHDDMTVPAIAKGLGLDLVLSAELLAVLERFCRDGVNDYLKRMAFVPVGSELLWDNGLAFPVLQIRNVHVFPGEPTLMRRKFEAIRDRFRTTPYVLRRIFTSCDEGTIAGAMEEAQQRCPGVQIGSYPTYDNPEYRVQITIESKDADKAQETVVFLCENIPREHILRID